MLSKARLISCKADVVPLGPLLAKLADDEAYLFGWPFDVPFPIEVKDSDRAKKQGVFGGFSAGQQKKIAAASAAMYIEKSRLQLKPLAVQDGSPALWLTVLIVGCDEDGSRSKYLTVDGRIFNSEDSETRQAAASGEKDKGRGGKGKERYVEIDDEIVDEIVDDPQPSQIRGNGPSKSGAGGSGTGGRRTDRAVQEHGPEVVSRAVGDSSAVALPATKRQSRKNGATTKPTSTVDQPAEPMDTQAHVPSTPRRSTRRHAVAESPSVVTQPSEAVVEWPQAPGRKRAAEDAKSLRPSKKPRTGKDQPLAIIEVRFTVADSHLKLLFTSLFDPGGSV